MNTTETYTGKAINDQKLAYSYRRFSSAKQEGNDSIRRQTKSAQDWCDQNGYTLSEATFEDLGVSAFKGNNAEVGALRGFLEAVEEGTVQQGATLLVENLDRLSRQHWQRGLTLLQDIVESGVNLVTLADGKMFKANEPIEFADGIMLLVGFERAHQESAFKSERVRAAWETNTSEVREGKRLRAVRPRSWLKLNGDFKTDNAYFTVVEDKTKIVQEIFERFASGDTPTRISKDLHSRGIPALTRGAWHSSTISKLVRSEAPYGHLELGRMLIDDERSGKIALPDGHYRKGNRVIFDKVRDYYPRVVDYETEAKVRFRLSNREAAGGAKNKPDGQVRVKTPCLQIEETA